MNSDLLGLGCLLPGGRLHERVLDLGVYARHRPGPLLQTKLVLLEARIAQPKTAHLVADLSERFRGCRAISGQMRLDDRRTADCLLPTLDHDAASPVDGHAVRRLSDRADDDDSSILLSVSAHHRELVHRDTNSNGHLERELEVPPDFRFLQQK
jgi:hypothetical protein